MFGSDQYLFGSFTLRIHHIIILELQDQEILKDSTKLALYIRNQACSTCTLHIIMTVVLCIRMHIQNICYII